MKTRYLTMTAACIALGVVLPQALHAIPNAGSVMLPMHIPVLLCGLICSWQYGLVCGVLTPVLSHLITGMPPAAYLLPMIVELAVYGLLAGIVIHLVRTKSFLFNTYAALLLAMVGGRICYGAVNALIFRAGAYSMQIWLTSGFVTALPGIILQLIVIPVLCLALKKAQLIDER
jgi:Protein of unknown function (DUF1393).